MYWAIFISLLIGIGTAAVVFLIYWGGIEILYRLTRAMMPFWPGWMLGALIGCLAFLISLHTFSVVHG